MEFLQKLMVIPQNIINTLKKMKSQTDKVENIYVEPLIFCQESKIETIYVQQFDLSAKRKKITQNQETQTESQSQPEQMLKINQVTEIDQQKKIKIGLSTSKSNKKCSKLLSKQIIQDENISRASDQTEPSQYSYCQNHFLTVLEQNEEQYKLEQKKIYRINQKNQKQYRNQILKNYISKFKEKQNDEKQNDEKQILKSTRTQSSDERQDSIDQKEQENNQQKQTLV
ncbi:unnamed protein product [Paramecium sonneborni]|uniref:Uncharacterized protein n=1 Tax=Paramecium sonneborni TaxID=65129 RepID=A0A8S1NCG5_9CILI|nr:unnamed protein product [Paramecium sonneborni]